MPKKKGKNTNPKPSDALTRKQKDFADKVLEGKSGTQAAVESYNVKNRKTASVIAAENLAKPSIEAYLQDLGYKARSFLERVLDGDDINGKVASTNTRVDVAKFLDDKATGKAQSKMDVTSQGKQIVVQTISYLDPDEADDSSASNDGDNQDTA